LSKTKEDVIETVVFQVCNGTLEEEKLFRSLQASSSNRRTQPPCNPRRETKSGGGELTIKCFQMDAK